MKKFPLHGWLGIILIAVFWYLNWSLEGLRTQWCFFPLWFGYVLTIDGILLKRKGTSPVKRGLRNFIMLFVISIPVWWLFEVIDLFTKNWIYAGVESFTGIQYFFLASLNFSIVMPAVFETAELVSTFNSLKHFQPKYRLLDGNSSWRKYFLTGVVMFLLTLFLPEYFYYLEWVSLYFIFDSVNLKLNNRNLIIYTRDGNWSPVISLAVGCLTCGFFWEMWNYFSYPKWIYYLPHLDFLHIFEMPVLGYIGYVPFSFELFAIYNLIASVKIDGNGEYILIGDRS